MTPPAEGRPRVLVIDDDLMVREMLQGFLMASGIASDAAACGREGLALLERARYDLVITDLMMDDISGLEIVTAVRRDYEGTPIAILTALTPEEVGAQGVEVLTKPIALDAFRAAVARLLASPHRAS
jgi:DNA-binding response OmpR family regulator